MAVTSDAKVVDVLAPSSNVNSAVLGPLYVNLLRLHNAWMTRPGMGQVAQVDAALTTPAATEQYGFEKLLGSYVLRTNFDHIQILSVVLARVTPNASQGESNNSDAYLVVIYDTTSDQWHQEVLFAHTAATISAENQMPTATQQWPENPASKQLSLLAAVDEQISFAEYQDGVAFCAPNMGAWMYSPCDFDGVPDPLQIDGWRGSNGTTPFATPYGESACVAPIVATVGNNPDASYLDSGGFPRPTCITVIGGAIAYGAGRTVYFSEPGKPGSIPSDTTYILNIQMQNPMTAMAQNNGYLYIFSNTETWICQTDPSAPAAGQLTQLSYDIGCVGPNAWCKVESELTWASLHDIHAVRGGPYNITSICDEMRPLFDEKLANPLSSYYQTLGNLGDNTSLDSSLMYWSWRELGNVLLSYDYRLRTLYVSVPQEQFVLIRQTSGDNESWGIWTFQSIVQSLTSVSPPNTQIGVENYLSNASILCLEGRVWLTSGIDLFVPPNNWRGQPASGSIVICEQGRGGGLDRSSIPQEDQRNFGGQWRQVNPTLSGQTDRYYCVVDRPRYMPPGTILPTGPAQQQVAMYPIRILFDGGLSASSTIEYLQIQLGLNGDFVPLLLDSQNVGFVLPPERWASRGAFSVTWNYPQLIITFDPSNAPASWQCWPKMNNPQGQEALLMWIPFVLSGQNAQPQDLGYIINNLFLNYAHLRTESEQVSASMHLWSEPMPSTLQMPENAKARPVDWQAKSEQIGVKGTQQIKTRGMFANMLTSGASDEQLVTPWVHGLLNLSATSDWKDWASQLVDFATWPLLPDTPNNIVTVEKQSALNAGAYPNLVSSNQPQRMRLLDNTGAMQINAFNVGSYWSSQDDQTTGNSLAGDEAYDTLSMSLVTKGEHVSLLMFGHVQNRAERLVINSAKAVFRIVGGARRWGR